LWTPNLMAPPKKPPPDTKAHKIVSLALHTNAPPQEIADIVNTSRQHVHQTLERYGIDTKDLETYKDRRAEVLAGLQDKILKTVDDASIKDASVLQKVTAFGILYDKERLERGQTTQNIGALIGMIHQIQTEQDAA
jgi:predicted DNA-binding protein YlxM (UPF0122 family)